MTIFAMQIDKAARAQRFTRRNNQHITHKSVCTCTMSIYANPRSYPRFQFVRKQNTLAEKTFAPKLTGKLTGLRAADYKEVHELTEEEACTVPHMDLETALLTPVGTMVCAQNSGKAIVAFCDNSRRVSNAWATRNNNTGCKQL